ncbi:MAG: aminotransferase class V-fold PLP-dependent enzyme [Edaphobacter sp.]
MRKFSSTEINRRGFMGGLAFLAGSVFGGHNLFAAAPAAPNAQGAWKGKITGLGESGNVYAELGLTPVINAQGTETVLGGSLIRPEVQAVMDLAAKHFVVIMDLEAAAGKRIAEMLKLPQGYGAIITSGAASAIQNGYSGILTGNDEENILRIPDLTGMKSEVIIQRAHRSPWDHQIRATGAKIVEVETVDDVHKAINERTAAMHFLNLKNRDGKIKREEWVKLAHAANVPSFVDAAADTPPKSRLSDYANMGFDLIAFSGGKAIRGPQCTGMLIGRQELVHNALLNMSPNEDTLGRPTKVGKEEIIGMMKALELYLAEDQAVLDKDQWRQLNTVANKVLKIPGVTVTRDVPEIENHFPALQIHLDPSRFSAKPHDIAQQLAKMNPSIVVTEGPSTIEMTAIALQPGEDKIVADALSSVLTAHSA